jgi:hypothetical protein
MDTCRRRFLRKIQLLSVGWQNNQARTAFRMLKDATGLRTMKVHHSNVCCSFDSWSWRFRSSGTFPEVFAAYADRAIRGILVARKVDGRSGLDALDIIEVTWERCSGCKNGFPEDDEMCIYGRHSAFSDGCRTPCRKAEKHCQALTEKIRKYLMKRLGIKDPVGNSEDDLLTPLASPSPRVEELEEVGELEASEGVEDEEGASD